MPESHRSLQRCTRRATGHSQLTNNWLTDALAKARQVGQGRLVAG